MKKKRSRIKSIFSGLVYIMVTLVESAGYLLSVLFLILGFTQYSILILLWTIVIKLHKLEWKS